MSRRIQIKRGLLADMPILAVGELGYATDTNELYVGTVEGVNVQVNDPKTVKILYEELVELRDNAQLIPGTWYQIIDYVTTAVQADTISAGHPFDIIVQALDEKTLSENAFAINSARDTEGYFDGMKLEAWKLKYRLTHEAKYYETDNEYEGNYVGIINTDGQTFYAYEYSEDYYILFNEAFSVDPEDVMIYELSSESIVDSFYDWEGGGNFFVYKPIQSIEGYKGYIYELIDEKNNKLSYDFKNIKFKREVNGHDFDYFYTFDYNGSDTSLLSSVNNNEIRTFEFQNNIVFFGNYFHSNTIGNNSYNNTIGNYFYDNTIGNNFRYNTVGNSFGSNTIGNDFCDNTIGNNFYGNTIGDDFDSNTIGIISAIILLEIVSGITLLEIISTITLLEIISTKTLLEIISGITQQAKMLCIYNFRLMGRLTV